MVENFLRILEEKYLETSIYFFPFGSTAQFWAMAASMKLSVSFRLLDLGQSPGLLGRRKASANCPG
jgi:hypothetical protein